MRSESNANENSPVGLVDEIAPKSPWRVTKVEALPGFRLKVAFADGLVGTVDLSRMVQSPQAGVFAALRDASMFSQVKLEYGAVTWPGELDLAPDAMHAAILEHGEWSL
ncbi:MAG: DUF2442 domain-containing protein [Terracidiphilus sp.]|jgi:hypothetical protein